MKNRRLLQMIMLGILLTFCLICSGCATLAYFLGEAKSYTAEETDEPYVSGEAKQYNKAVDDFFSALDNHDKDAILELFAPSVLAHKEALDSQIDQLFAFYTGPTDICKRNGSMVAGSYSTNYGEECSEVDSGFPVVSNGKYYWCYFKLMYENDEDEKEIGVKNISLYSAGASLDRRGDSEKTGIYVYPGGLSDNEVRFVGGYPEKYVDIDRILTAAQVTDFFKTSDSYTEFETQFGAPNAADSSGVSFVYELPLENGKLRYLQLIVDTSTDEIVTAVVDSDLEFVYLLWEKKK